MELNLRLGLAETGDAIAVLPLAALFEKFGALEALEDIALATPGWTPRADCDAVT